MSEQKKSSRSKKIKKAIAKRKLKTTTEISAATGGSNPLGLNTPQIAATENEYEEMWAQDVSAMINHH